MADRQLDAEVPITDWDDDLALLDAETTRLIDSMGAMSDAQVTEPSGLPGWSRGHVLAHLDGNAQGLGRVARWARDGIERPMYISRDVRDADVELHAARSSEEHRHAVTQSARALRADLGAIDSMKREDVVILGNGLSVRAGSLARHRLGEVCVHHADLGLADYTWRDWPDSMAWHMARLVTRDFAVRGEFPVAAVAWGTDRLDIVPGDEVLEGSPQALLAWLLGRSAGEGLVSSSGGSVPAAPTWR
jgi:maleylpyruvate isomerase